MDELELDQDENRYETQQQAQQQSEEQQQEREVRQVLNRLRELARRQEDLNKELAQLQSALEKALPIEKEEQESSSQAWRDFITKAADCSASVAHRYTKVPLSIGPSVTDGSCNPRDVQLQQQVDL